MAGNRERAEDLLDLATVTYERTGEHAYVDLILFARASLRFDGNEIAGVESLLFEAVERARQDETLMYELIYCTHLARLAPRTGKAEEARERLAKLYVRLTEGFDRPPVLAAKAALDALAEMSAAQAAVS